MQEEQLVTFILVYNHTQRLCVMLSIILKEKNTPQPGGRGETKQQYQNTEIFRTVTFDQTADTIRINAIIWLPLVVTHIHATVSGHYITVFHFAYLTRIKSIYCTFCWIVFNWKLVNVTFYEYGSCKGFWKCVAAINTHAESQQISLLIITIIKTEWEQLWVLAKASRYSNRPAKVQYNL